MGKGGGKGTPDDIDYLFERDIVDEEDYTVFWPEYWEAVSKGKEAEVVREWEERAALSMEPVSVGIVTKIKDEAIKQAQALGDLGAGDYKVVRRNARGQFSKRGGFYQAVRNPKRGRK